MKEPPVPKKPRIKSPPLPSYLFAAAPSTRERSIEQEDEWAERLKGDRVKGSGSYKFRPGDMKTEEYLTELKTTRLQSFPLTVGLLEKITREAERVNRKPVFGVQFEKAPAGLEKDWAIVPLSVLEELLSR